MYSTIESQELSEALRYYYHLNHFLQPVRLSTYDVIPFIQTSNRKEFRVGFTLCYADSNNQKLRYVGSPHIDLIFRNGQWLLGRDVESNGLEFSRRNGSFASSCVLKVTIDELSDCFLRSLRKTVEVYGLASLGDFHSQLIPEHYLGSISNLNVIQGLSDFLKGGKGSHMKMPIRIEDSLDSGLEICLFGVSSDFLALRISCQYTTVNHVAIQCYANILVAGDGRYFTAVDNDLTDISERNVRYGHPILENGTYYLGALNNQDGWVDLDKTSLTLMSCEEFAPSHFFSSDSALLRVRTLRSDELKQVIADSLTSLGF